MLLGDCNRLGLFLSDAHTHAAFGRRDRQLAIAELTDQVKRLLGFLLPRQPQRIALHGALHRLSHRRGRPEVAVRRHQPRKRLVRTVEVVVVDEVAQPPIAVGVVGEDRARQHLVPQGLPKTLDLPERLRVLRSALDVPHAVTAHQLLEGRLTPPRGVLPALVGQDLGRRAVLRRRALECLEHQLGALVMRQRVPDHVTRVVVHEGDQIQPLVPPQQECEEVRLPQLVGGRPLEASGRLRAAFALGRSGVDEALLVQHAAHRALGDPEALVPGELVAEAPGAGLRLGSLGLHDRVAPRVALECPLARRLADRQRDQAVHPVGS